MTYTYKTAIPTLLPEELKRKFFSRESNHVFTSPNFNLFYVSSVEGTCDFLKQPTPPHRNAVHELILLTEGSIFRNVGLDTFEIKKNNAFILPAGQITTIETITKNTKGFYCHFDASVLIKKFINLHLINEFEFLRLVSNPVVKLPPQVTSNICYLMRRLKEVNTRFVSEDLVQSYLLTILLEIKQHYQIPSIKSISPAQYLTDRFKELIATYYQSNRPLSWYAQTLNVSLNHLNKSVKSITGKPPSKWLNEYIVLEAKVLLSQCNLSISEVSYLVGIEDPSYFGRVFKKHTGSTPTDFRKYIASSSTNHMQQ